MRFLLDENVHVAVLAFIQKLGHDIVRAPLGIRNGDIIKLLLQEKRALITHDKDFLDLKRYPPKMHLGIICIRIHPPITQEVTEGLKMLLDKVPADQFQGATFELTSNSFIRRQ